MTIEDDSHAIDNGHEETADVGEAARTFLAEVLDAMGLEASVEARELEDGSFRVEMRGPEMSVVIGRQGTTLSALQYLTTLVVTKRTGQRVRLVLDAEGYRSRREEALRETARVWAEKVKETGQECVLDPMSPFDRRIVHTALADDPEIYTYSEGDEPDRCVVISPRGADDPSQEGEETP